MTLYSIYIYNRFGDSIYCKHWKRTRPSQDGEAGLIAGFVYTLQHIASQLAPNNNGKFLAMQTPMYKLHYYETLTGYRAALFTDKDTNTAFAQDVLAEIFKTAFLKAVVQDPNYTHDQNSVIERNEFESKLEELLNSKNLLETERDYLINHEQSLA